MSVKRLRVDSIKELKQKKTLAELQAENEELKAQTQILNDQLTDTQLALCDVYEMLVGGEE